MEIRWFRRFWSVAVWLGVLIGAMGISAERCWGQHRPGAYGTGHHGGFYHGGGAGYVPRYTVPPTFRPTVPSYGYVNPAYRSGTSSFGFSIRSGGAGFSYQSYAVAPSYALGLGYGIPGYSAYRVVVPVLPPYQPLYPELGVGGLSPQVPMGEVTPWDAGLGGVSSMGGQVNSNPAAGVLTDETLRPGMILPDGAQVLSVGPTHGGVGRQVPGGAAKPAVAPVPSDRSIKL